MHCAELHCTVLLSLSFFTSLYNLLCNLLYPISLLFFLIFHLFSTLLPPLILPSYPSLLQSPLPSCFLLSPPLTPPSFSSPFLPHLALPPIQSGIARSDKRPDQAEQNLKDSRDNSSNIFDESGHNGLHVQTMVSPKETKIKSRGKDCAMCFVAY
jgi:hypothetical protein